MLICHVGLATQTSSSTPCKIKRESTQMGPDNLSDVIRYERKIRSAASFNQITIETGNRKSRISFFDSCGTATGEREGVKMYV